MLAQYRAGRRAEALETFRGGRESSIEESASNPALALRDLHDAILRDDPALTLVQPASDRSTVIRRSCHRAARVRRRAAELSILDDPADRATLGRRGDRACRRRQDRAGLHWAHRVADRFDDGQLYVDPAATTTARRPPTAGPCWARC